MARIIGQRDGRENFDWHMHMPIGRVDWRERAVTSRRIETRAPVREAKIRPHPVRLPGAVVERGSCARPAQSLLSAKTHLLRSRGLSKRPRSVCSIRYIAPTHCALMSRNAGASASEYSWMVSLSSAFKRSWGALIERPFRQHPLDCGDLLEQWAVQALQHLIHGRLHARPDIDLGA